MGMRAFDDKIASIFSSTAFAPLDRTERQQHLHHVGGLTYPISTDKLVMDFLVPQSISANAISPPANTKERSPKVTQFSRPTLRRTSRERKQVKLYHGFVLLSYKPQKRSTVCDKTYKYAADEQLSPAPSPVLRKPVKRAIRDKTYKDYPEIEETLSTISLPGKKYKKRAASNNFEAKKAVSAVIGCPVKKVKRSKGSDHNPRSPDENENEVEITLPAIHRLIIPPERTINSNIPSTTKVAHNFSRSPWSCSPVLSVENIAGFHLLQKPSSVECKSKKTVTWAKDNTIHVFEREETQWPQPSNGRPQGRFGLSRSQKKVRNHWLLGPALEAMLQKRKLERREWRARKARSRSVSPESDFL